MDMLALLFLFWTAVLLFASGYWYFGILMLVLLVAKVVDICLEEDSPGG